MGLLPKNTNDKINRIANPSYYTPMKPIILFGTGKIAEVILYFFTHHSDRQVVACSVDKVYLPGSEWQGIPAVPFDEITLSHPPETHDMFVALGYQDMNALRTGKCAEARQLGYTLASYIHPDSGLPSDCAHGDNCFIMNQVLIHPRVRLGNNVFVWSGAMVGHHSSIGDNCWLTSGANISGVVDVGNNCFFAVNSTIGNSVHIGANNFIGANALVTKSTDEDQVFIAESSKPHRLTSRQFFRMSRFSDI
jgi:sugar O-acyltransferase (sialic acid O-acetyltransferase NeuD family)